MAGTATPEQTEQWLAARQAFPEVAQMADQRTAWFLGGLALQGEVSVERVTDPSNESTLMAAVQLAALGDKQSEQVVFNNVSSDVVERMQRVAAQTKIKLQITGNEFRQEQRSLIDVNQNTFLHTVLNAEMFGRATSQLKNGHLFNGLLEAGVFEKYDALVFEPCSTDEQTKRDYNFFQDTDSMSVQLLKVEGHGAVLETALVAGKKTPDSPRHDMEMIKVLAESKQLELVPTEVNGMVQYVMLLPKKDTPRNIEDVVAECDDITGTFYGQAKPRQDYREYAKQCYELNESFNDIVETITATLLNEAHAFTSPIEVIHRLDYLSGRLCVRRARTDKRIDLMVFGAEAAMHIDEARAFYEAGDVERGNQAMQKAHQADTSGSCPLFKELSSMRSKDDGSGNSEEEKSEAKWMNCPHCEARVFADPCAKILKCWDCKAAVIHGVTIAGDGGSKKRNAEKAKHRAEQKEARVPEVLASVTSLEDRRRSVELASHVAKEDSTMRVA